MADKFMQVFEGMDLTKISYQIASLNLICSFEIYSKIGTNDQARRENRKDSGRD